MEFGETRYTYRILKQKTFGQPKHWRLRRMWEDDIKTDLRDFLTCEAWTLLRIVHNGGDTEVKYLGTRGNVFG
jgi:hypothetical protein